MSEHTGPAHRLSRDDALRQLDSSPRGLTSAEAAARLARHGPNTLPRGRAPGLGEIFLGQFKSPLIYVLLVAAVLSLALQKWSDAVFIFVVLVINAVVGTFQEYRAERASQALAGLASGKARVVRNGDTFEIAFEEVVPGDIVLLESGARVPADLRLLESHNLALNESLLTGESVAAGKNADSTIAEEAAIGERVNMAFAGTLVETGRARGLTVATGAHTELGRIAEAVLGRQAGRPPLVERMERFTHRIALMVAVAMALMIGLSVARGEPLAETFIIAVALAVAAIPEGLPVALTAALAVGMERMARRAVIVRQLVAVESLGSCTYIASDKTGTLTVNQLTVRRLQFPHQAAWEVTGEGLVPEGTFLPPPGASIERHGAMIENLARCAALANEATLARHDDDWVGHGDSVDLALLVMAHKAGLTQPGCNAETPQVAALPYESERRFSASLNRSGEHDHAFVKGAVETVLPMCTRMVSGDGEVEIQPDEILTQAQQLAAQGYRVLAAAEGAIPLATGETLSAEHLGGLRFAGLIAMTDPPRSEVLEAVEACRTAGIRVGMITGDHPLTALAIARDIGLDHEADTVVTGAELAAAAERGQDAFDHLCRTSTVFARVAPEQKLRIVESLQRDGHFVAVTGDGVNDAPALRAAQVGVAMGQRGTDVARETAAIIVTDDNFASIVAGIEEGRIAYANVRKVITLLIGTGAAEIVLFALALIAGLPLPLLAVQLLWLNLVTNGIQDVALAFEPAEGGELEQRPRPPRQGIFDRMMIERVVLSALVIGCVAFAVFHVLLGRGYSVEEARNGTLLLMVLFENVQAFNCRSETRSVFGHNPLRNKLLLFGALLAQGVHIGAMFTPGLREVLGVQPVSAGLWGELLVLALTLLLAMEWHKRFRAPRLVH
jgi:magnesium-transporting ATPase (P-type)